MLFVISLNELPSSLAGTSIAINHTADEFSLPGISGAAITNVLEIPEALISNIIDGHVGDAAQVQLVADLLDSRGEPYFLYEAELDGSLTEVEAVCFAAGSLIDTDRGTLPVEELHPGDRVVTRDNGYQPVVWIGAGIRNTSRRFAPIRIAAGTLGASRDLIVSPHHRVLLTGKWMSAVFGENEMLVAVKDLLNGTTIKQLRGKLVAYHHILFERHEIVRSHGVWSESLHPYAAADSLDSGSLAEIEALFPNLSGYGPHARADVRSFEIPAVTVESRT